MTKWHYISTAPVPRRSPVGFFCICAGLIAAGLAAMAAGSAVLYYFIG